MFMKDENKFSSDFPTFKVETWSWRDSIMVRVLFLHMADLVSIPGTLYVPLSPVRNSP